MVKVDEKIEEAIKEIFSGDKPWVTIVWDDPVNLMSYVTYVLMELFGYTREKAHELMMKVHTEGKAVVSTGSREEMEHDVARDRKSTRLNSSHWITSRMPSSA